MDVREYTLKLQVDGELDDAALERVVQSAVDECFEGATHRRVLGIGD